MTDETKYTAGPWTWYGDELLSPSEFVMGASKGNWPIENDARLIAAAPELLEALMAVEMARHTDAKEDWLKATALTESAIVKATVRSK